MEYQAEYQRWLSRVTGPLSDELKAMDEATVEDAFYRELAFGTGGLRGVLGAGTNRMNTYVVARASQGLAEYLGAGSSVVIGYDTRILSDEFARVAAGVFVANGLQVRLWPRPLPVPTVSFAVRALGASAGVMITASHNPAKYNGYKVYGPDGCQITTAVADAVCARICALDYFADVRTSDFERGVAQGRIRYIEDADRALSIVYTPLNGTGLIPVTRTLAEEGFTNVTVVEEQREPDGRFPTCPSPNPEIREAMALGLSYCERTGADLLLATDPDCDRCGIAVRTPEGSYQLLTGNEVGLLLLDYVCSQRRKHGKMPSRPVFIKTIVTISLAERIAAHYGVETVNVLTGFKFIGETIGRLETQGRDTDFICGFEESYGYLTGSYVRDKDGVNAAFLICEMCAFYKARGVGLLQRLDEIYAAFGYCLNTLHTYEFDSTAGARKMQSIMQRLRDGLESVGGLPVTETADYLAGIDGLPKADVLRFSFGSAAQSGSVVIRPSGTEPKLKAYISVTATDRTEAKRSESRVVEDLEQTVFR